MAKCEKFNPEKHLRGLAEAAVHIQIDELIRDGKMVSLNQVVAAIVETREKYRPQILSARKRRTVN